VKSSLQEQMLIQDQVNASLVFNVTSYLNILGQKMDPDKDFTWFPYGDAGLDIYSNGVMVSPKLAKEKPEAVKGLVRAINKAMMEVLANPKAGVAVVTGIEPLLNGDLEEKRLAFAVKNLIISDESKANGVGSVDMDRLTKSIGIIKELYDLPVTPDASTIFSDAFLPSADERML
jgi:NitT/TauT family transport system substrate-binding protein